MGRGAKQQYKERQAASKQQTSITAIIATVITDHPADLQNAMNHTLDMMTIEEAPLIITTETTTDVTMTIAIIAMTTDGVRPMFRVQTVHNLDHSTDHHLPDITRESIPERPYHSREIRQNNNYNNHQNTV